MAPSVGETVWVSTKRDGRGYLRAAPLAAVRAGGAAIGAIVLIEFFEGRWSLRCGGSGTRILDLLMWAEFAFAVAAVGLGVAGLFAAGSRSKSISGIGIALGMAVCGLLLVPYFGTVHLHGIGSYACWSSAA